MEDSLKPPVGNSDFEESQKQPVGEGLDESLKPPIGEEASLKPPIGGGSDLIEG